MSKKTKIVLGFNGFGFGVWRNHPHAHQTIWTVAFGPMTFFINHLY